MGKWNIDLMLNRRLINRRWRLLNKLSRQVAENRVESEIGNQDAGNARAIGGNARIRSN